jgi:hypothetical protein
LRQLAKHIVCLARHVKARVLGDDSADVEHASMLDHFVEEPCVWRDAFDHDETDAPVGIDVRFLRIQPLV